MEKSRKSQIQYAQTLVVTMPHPDLCGENRILDIEIEKNIVQFHCQSHVIG